MFCITCLLYLLEALIKTSVFYVIDYGLLQNVVKTVKNNAFNFIILVKLLEYSYLVI